MDSCQECERLDPKFVMNLRRAALLIPIIASANSTAPSPSIPRGCEQHVLAHISLKECNPHDRFDTCAFHQVVNGYRPQYTLHEVKRLSTSVVLFAWGRRNIRDTSQKSCFPALVA